MITSFVLMLSCFISVPFINNAKDENNEFIWSILHMKTVVFTLITLILNVLVILRWNFTFDKSI